MDTCSTRRRGGCRCCTKLVDRRKWQRQRSQCRLESLCEGKLPGGISWWIWKGFICSLIAACLFDIPMQNGTFAWVCPELDCSPITGLHRLHRQAKDMSRHVLRHRLRTIPSWAMDGNFSFPAKPPRQTTLVESLFNPIHSTEANTRLLLHSHIEYADKTRATRSFSYLAQKLMLYH